MTRTPDCHFAAESRHNGSKIWVFSPDFSQVSKYADEWVAINAGQERSRPRELWKLLVLAALGLLLLEWYIYNRRVYV